MLRPTRAFSIITLKKRKIKMLPNRSYRSGPQSHPLRQSLTLFTIIVLMLMAFAGSVRGTFLPAGFAPASVTG